MRGRALARILLPALLSALPALEPGAATSQGSQSPALNYLQHCSGCHMLDGTGSTRNHVPTMLGSVGHFVRTTSGRAFLVQVAGVAQAPLSDQEVADLLNWLLPVFGASDMPAGFTPYSAAEVHAERTTRPADLMAVRAHVARELGELGYGIATY